MEPEARLPFPTSFLSPSFTQAFGKSIPTRKQLLPSKCQEGSPSLPTEQGYPGLSTPPHPHASTISACLGCEEAVTASGMRTERPKEGGGLAHHAAVPGSSVLLHLRAMWGPTFRLPGRLNHKKLEDRGLRPPNRAAEHKYSLPLPGRRLAFPLFHLEFQASSPAGSNPRGRILPL